MAPTITYTVTRGKHTGEQFTPHKHACGHYVVSKTRFKRDYVNVDTLDEVLRLLSGQWSCFPVIWLDYDY